MNVEVRRLAFGLAAEVRGVDPTRPVEPAIVQAIRAAWLEHQVLVFPEMKMSKAQHIAFSRCFGELEIHPMLSSRGSYPEYPEIVEVRSQPRPGREKPGTTAIAWHTDGVYTLRPPAGSLLHCQVIPDVGGNTWFTNMYMAYETLSDTMKGVVDGLSVVNNLAHIEALQRRMRIDPVSAAKDLEKLPPVIQPLVRVHPETGRKALYMSEATVQIHGMTLEEGAGLLKFLYDHSARPAFTYQHRWHVHDLVMWDNRCTMHMVPGDFDTTQLRSMHRTTLKGQPCGEPYKLPSPEATASGT